MAQPVFYVLSGMSFAGKSVLARAIAQRQHVKLVDPDEVAHAMGLGLESEVLSAETWAFIHAKAEMLAREQLILGRDVIYDTTAFNRTQRDGLRDLARRWGARPVVIAVRINRQEAYRRWERNNRTHERFTAHLDDFNACADAFKFPLPDEPHLMYEAGQDIESWIRANLP